MDTLSPLLGTLHPYDIVIRPRPFTRVQVKTHRKKRINKKWQTRYGFVEKLLPYLATDIVQHDTTFYVYPEMFTQVHALLRTAWTTSPHAGREGAVP